MTVNKMTPYQGMNEAFPYEQPDYGVYDPFLGYSKKNNDVPGYDVWPPGSGLKGKELVVMTTGGSTTDFGCARWPAYLGDCFIAHGIDAVILNGGVAGYSSSQEVIKLMRDIPALKPDLVVALSGINDFVWGHTRPEFPFLHSYQRRVAEHLCKIENTFESWVAGLPHREDKTEVWLRNVRLMQEICADSTASFLCCLQPTMVYGDYAPSNEERQDLLNPYSKKSLNDQGAYDEVAIRFYDAVRQRLTVDRNTYRDVIDLSQLFAGQSGLYRDYRHQNDRGDRIIAEAIFAEVQERFDFMEGKR